jgi:hypothetical protein
MRNIYYREQIVVDGTAYDVTTCDYSTTFDEWVKAGVVSADAPHHEIVDLVTDDIVNSAI